MPTTNAEVLKLVAALERAKSEVRQAQSEVHDTETNKTKTVAQKIALAKLIDDAAETANKGGLAPQDILYTLTVTLGIAIRKNCTSPEAGLLVATTLCQQILSIATSDPPS